MVCQNNNIIPRRQKQMSAICGPPFIMEFLNQSINLYNPFCLVFPKSLWNLIFTAHSCTVSLKHISSAERMANLSFLLILGCISSWCMKSNKGIVGVYDFLLLIRPLRICQFKVGLPFSEIKTHIISFTTFKWLFKVRALFQCVSSNLFRFWK